MPLDVVKTNDPNCLDGNKFVAHFSISRTEISNRGLMTPHWKEDSCRNVKDNVKMANKWCDVPHIYDVITLCIYQNLSGKTTKFYYEIAIKSSKERRYAPYLSGH